MLKTKNDVKRGKTGKGYKITRFNRSLPSHEKGKNYFLALFNPDEVTAFDGWYCEKLRYAKGDGENFINN